MQTVRAGELYFLKSPFHEETFDTDKEKRLCYLLGTVSARPAVVIRPPAWWDNFSMVTVIPALSRGNPALVYHLMDRYGRETRSDYPFVPHHATSIPVSRLGRYIGSMDPDELEELMYAYHWVMDPAWQNDPSKPIPKAYSVVANSRVPRGSWITQADPRSSLSITVDRENHFTSVTNPEIDGVTVPDGTAALHPKVEKEIAKEPEYVAVETALPDSVEIDEDKIPVPVEKKFPPSIFADDILKQVAGRFDLDYGYYLDKKVRDPYVLDPDKDGLRHNLSDKDFQKLLDYYATMQPLDAFLLGPRLPTYILVEITGLDTGMAVVLKAICNALRDMPEEEYQQRVKDREDADDEPETEEDTKEPVMSFMDYKTSLHRLKPYLNANKVDKIPANLREEFLNIPKGIIKRVWCGAQFEQAYKQAVALYTEKGA